MTRSTLYLGNTGTTLSCGRGFLVSTVVRYEVLQDLKPRQSILQPASFVIRDGLVTEAEAITP